MDRHIPKIKIVWNGQPVWFDTEAHQYCCEKERFHKNYKITEDLILRRDRYFKFSLARKTN